MRKIFVLLSFLFIISFYSISQVQKMGIPEIEFFNRRMYSAATQNWDVSQSKSGFIYFANNEGVLEYDGEHWAVYDGVGSFIVRCVKAIDDKIYAGSYKELGYFKHDSLSNLKYTSFATTPDLTELDDFWNILLWNDKVVFHSEKGICFFKDDKLLSIIPTSSRFISSFVVNGMLLVHDEKHGLMEVRGDHIFPVSGGGVFAGMEVTTVLPLSGSEIVIGTMKNGMYLWNMQEIKKWDVSSNPLLETVNIFCGVKYDDNFLVFGTIQGGLVITDVKGNVFMQIDKDKGLKNNTVLSVDVDFEGNIWCGLDNGIARVGFKSGVSFLQGYYNLGTGYLMDEYKGEFYFGTNQALYKISVEDFYNPLKGREDFERIPGTEGQVWSLYKDENSVLCGHNLGVFDVSGSVAWYVTPPEINGVWNFRAIPDKPSLLISGTYNGLVLFEKVRGVWKYKRKIEGFYESSRFIEFDNEGFLWISHGYNGVYKLELDTTLTKVLQVDTFFSHSANDNPGALVLSKINEECIFSGSKGVYGLNANKNGFERQNQYDAFFSEGHFPSVMREDKYKNLWCFIDGKICVLRYLEDGTYKKIQYPFVPLDRKLVNGFEHLYVMDMNNVFFGVEDGFAHYAIEDYNNYKTPFKVHIRSFVGNGDSIRYQLNNMGDSAVQYIIPEFAFRSNSFEIHYAASFHAQRGVEYSTYLKNFDTEPLPWEPTSGRSFSNLHEGTYEFEVRAKNTYSVVSDPISFKFVITPPWYRSLVAKMSYGVFTVVLLLMTLYFFNKRIELSKKKEMLKQKERFKAKEDQLKNSALMSEKEMIRIRNEKLRGEMVFKEKELANSTIHLIQKNDLLSDIKLQLKKIIKISERQESERKINSLIKKIDKDIDNENNWEVFEMHFGQVHDAFLKSLNERHPDLSIREQKLSAYIKMGMSSKEIASLMNITTRAVENNRYKLRQKLGIQHGENLISYITKLQ